MTTRKMKTGIYIKYCDDCPYNKTHYSGVCEVLDTHPPIILHRHECKKMNFEHFGGRIPDWCPFWDDKE